MKHLILISVLLLVGCGADSEPLDDNPDVIEQVRVVGQPVNDAWTDVAICITGDEQAGLAPPVYIRYSTNMTAPVPERAYYFYAPAEVVIFSDDVDRTAQNLTSKNVDLQHAMLAHLRTIAVVDDRVAFNCFRNVLPY